MVGPPQHLLQETSNGHHQLGKACFTDRPNWRDLFVLRMDKKMEEDTESMRKFVLFWYFKPCKQTKHHFHSSLG